MPPTRRRTRVPRPCAPNSLFGTRGTIRYSKFGTRLLAVLFISALRAVCRTRRNREVAISLDLATKCSDARIGRKQDAVSVINRRSRRASLAAPHLIPRLTHVP